MIYEKKPYELSLWEDQIEDNTLKEKRICIISSDKMDTPIKAYNITLTRKVNGENTLTFSIAANFFNQETEEYIINPFLSLLSNERKVKLKVEKNKQTIWYDFIIKNVSEDSQNGIYTYTAKDQHVQELSKNGFGIVFDKELENNTKTATEFAEEILGIIKDDNGNTTGSETGWFVDESDSLIEYMDEPVYKLEVEDLSVTEILNNNKDTISGIIYIPYSVANGQDDFFQFQYSSEYAGEEDVTKLPKDDDGVLSRDFFKNYTAEKPGSMGNLVYGCRGSKLVRIPKSKYDPKLDRYVNIYENNGTKYYGFTETEYQTPDFVQSIITNGYDFSSTTGWGTVVSSENGVVTASSRELYVYPEVKNWTDPDSVKTYIKTTGSIFNHGFFDGRNKIKGLVIGQEYILRIKAFSDLTDATNYISPTKVDICDYAIEGAHYAKKADGFTYFSREKNEKGEDKIEYKGNYFFEIPLIVCKALNEKELSHSQIGIFLDFNKEVFIEEAWLFPKIYDKDNSNVIYPTKNPDANALDSDKIIKTHYYYFDPNADANTDYEDKESIEFSYDGYSPNDAYNLQYEDSYEKRRTITAKESNRFNLLQEVCETFECWLKINIARNNDTGEITRKSISFQEYVGKENHSGFKYGINLNNIKRTIDSDKIVTKLIVKDNSNEFGKNGFCSISRAGANPSGTNNIYNFDYYISQGLLPQQKTEAALYDSENGLYPKLREQSKELDRITEEIVGVSKNIVQLEATVEYEQARLEAAEELFLTTREDLKRLTRFSYEQLSSNSSDVELKKWKEDEQIIPYMVKIFTADRTIKEATTNKDNAKTALVGYNSQFRTLSEEQESALEALHRIEQNFFKTYSRYIQEGSWISEDYTDDNLYYLDALSTLYTSAKPQISYTINVFDLSMLEEYENYDFDIGDKSFIEDTEFFGWKIVDGVKTPYHEEVIISEVTEGIDDPTKNNFKIQNYKTQFDDLFQRIAATTEQLQYSTGRYERFANTVEQDGSLSYKALQQTVDENGLAIANAGVQSVSCDERGIITIDKALPSNQVRVIGGGIFMTTDGGETWKTGLTGEGINANVITTGQLNAAEVNIMTDTAPSHKWDKKGITAYSTTYNISDGTINSVDTSNFVRFDEFGIYGIKNNASFDARVIENGSEYGIAKIQKNSTFSLTADGLTLGKLSDSSGIFLSQEGKIYNDSIAESEKDLEWVIKAGSKFGVTKDGTIYAIAGKIGGWIITTKAGLRTEILSQNDETAPSTASEGLMLLSPEPRGLYHTDGHGWNDLTVANHTSKEWQFVCGSNFGVDKRGNVYATGGNIGGWTIKPNYLGYNIEDTDNENAIRIGENSLLLSPAGTHLIGSVAGVGGSALWNIIAGTNFGVTNEGKLYATAGCIGGWDITETRLKKGSEENRFVLDPTGSNTNYDSHAGSSGNKNWKLAIGKTFGVDEDGAIYATAGKIGGWTIGTDGLSYGNNNILLKPSATNADIVFKAGSNFSVTADGNLYASNANISGVIVGNGLRLENLVYIKSYGNGGAQIGIKQQENSLLQQALIWDSDGELSFSGTLKGESVIGNGSNSTDGTSGQGHYATGIIISCHGKNSGDEERYYLQDYIKAVMGQTINPISTISEETTNETN